MRVLIVTNMYPTAERPGLGSFVRDQVRALQRLPEIDLELYAFEPGSLAGYGRAGIDLRRQFRGRRFDVVHAHYGLTAWPSLAVRAHGHMLTVHGTDLHHPRTRPISLAVMRGLDQVAAVSAELALRVPRWAVRRPVAVLPCGVDMDRFHPLSRAEARRALGRDPDRPCVLFPADPARPEKRVDLARATVGDDADLLVLSGVAPEQVPLMVNAANAVLVPSDREGFGLATLEALSCNVPVLATPHGIAPEVLAGLTGAYCGPFDAATWRAALAPHLAGADPRIEGRERAEPYSADRMAQRVAASYRSLVETVTR